VLATLGCVEIVDRAGNRVLLPSVQMPKNFTFWRSKVQSIRQCRWERHRRCGIDRALCRVGRHNDVQQFADPRWM